MVVPSLCVVYAGFILYACLLLAIKFSCLFHIILQHHGEVMVNYRNGT